MVPVWPVGARLILFLGGIFMKTMKKFTIGMAVLLGVSLFLAGCPTDSDDGGSTPAKVPNNVAKDYALKASEAGNAGASASGVEIDTATELDGVVTIKLRGRWLYGRLQVPAHWGLRKKWG
jgi:Tfp pilus assembly protein PilZ